MPAVDQRATLPESRCAVTALAINIIEDRYPSSQVKDANLLLLPNLDAAMDAQGRMA